MWPDAFFHLSNFLALPCQGNAALQRHRGALQTLYCSCSWIFVSFEVGFYWGKQVYKKIHYILLLPFLVVLPSCFTYNLLPFTITGHKGSVTLPPNNSGFPSQRQYKCVLCSFREGVQRGGGEESVTWIKLSRLLTSS